MEKFLNDDEIMEILKKYIDMRKSTEYAILIDGAWGSGKTYFVDKVFEKYLKENKKQYSKISLYGVTSKKEIDNKITESLLESSNPKFGKYLASAFSNIDNTVKFASMTMPKPLIDIIGNIDFNSVLAKFQNIDKHILIFDDFERCGIEPNIMLGYINEYIENKNNKVIVIANQKEVSKSKRMNNLELKYLAVKPHQKEFYSQNEIRKNDISRIYTQTTSNLNKINKEELDNRIEELFSEDEMYKKIKEKVIGREIYYFPDISNICKKMSEKINNDTVKKVIKLNSKNIAKKMNNERHNNIRTLKLVLEKIEDIMNGLEQQSIRKDKNYEKIMSMVLLNLLEEYIEKKKNDKLYKWEGNVKYDLKTGSVKFRFIDDILLTENIDFIEKNNVLSDCSKEMNSKIESNLEDPVFILKNYYWEIEDNEVVEKLDEIYDKIKGKDYEIKDYPKIVYILLRVKQLELDSFDLDKYLKLMKENMKNIKQKYNLKSDIYYSGFNIENEEIRKEYDKILEDFNKILNITINENFRNDINDIINAKDGWGTEFEKYINAEKGYRNDIQVYLEIDINNLIKTLKKSKSKDISCFRRAIWNCEISNEEIEKVKELIGELEKLLENERRKTQKYNIKLILNDIKSKVSV